MRGQRHASAAFIPRERPGTHCTGGWVGPKAGLAGAENLAPTGIRSPDPQPVISRYTDWATRPTILLHNIRHIYTIKNIDIFQLKNIYSVELCTCTLFFTKILSGFITLPECYPAYHILCCSSSLFHGTGSSEFSDFKDQLAFSRSCLTYFSFRSLWCCLFGESCLILSLCVLEQRLSAVT
jgi:hypothetical protein